MINTLRKFDVSASPIMEGRKRWESRVYCASRDTLLAMLKGKLGYLNQHLPRPDGPPGILTGSLMVWTPSKSDLSSFARRVEAAEDLCGHATVGPLAPVLIDDVEEHEF